LHVRQHVAWVQDAWLMHTSAVLNALAGPCMWSTAPLVSCPYPNPFPYP
jgi:hypothetical protein